MSNKIEDISIKNLHQKLINDFGTIADKTILDYGCGNRFKSSHRYRTLMRQQGRR